MKYLNFTVILVFVLICSVNVFAQETSLTETKAVRTDIPSYQVGVFVGVSSYEGDVHCLEEENLNIFTEANATFGVSFYKNFSKQLSGGVNLFFAKLSGTDKAFTSNKGHQQRGFSFTNNITEISLRVNYAPFGHKTWKVSPYVFGGVGLALGSADTDYNKSAQSDEKLKQLNTDIQNATASSFALPVGVGLTYRLNEKLDINLEAGMRFGLNDYMDGVSISGNDDIGDYYGIGGVSVQYYFGKPSMSGTIKEF
jgi:opacity protein-like surface antigen